MKMNTVSWLRLESKGYPDQTKTMQGTTREIVLAIAEWLSTVYMGSRIQITLARTEEELDSNARGPDAGMMAELNAILDRESV